MTDADYQYSHVLPSHHIAASCETVLDAASCNTILEAASHMRYSEVEERYFFCDLCHKSYKWKKALNRHKTYECPFVVDKPHFSCPYCRFVSKQKICVKKHIVIKHPGLPVKVVQKITSSIIEN
nr:PREDICTED: longitudinals lacking protein, isoforms N/O/W/X/Y-like [Bemisia tabaci]